MISLVVSSALFVSGAVAATTTAPEITAEPVPGQLEVMQGTAVKLGGAPSPDGPQPDSYHWEIVQGEGGTLYNEDSYEVIFQSPRISDEIELFVIRLTVGYPGAEPAHATAHIRVHRDMPQAKKEKKESIEDVMSDFYRKEKTAREANKQRVKESQSRVVSHHVYSGFYGGFGHRRTIVAPKQSFIVRALDLGFERVAAPAPMAVVVAGAVSKVEVAIRFALLSGFAPDTGEQLLALVVVARSEALGIIIINEAVAIVIRAVSAGRDAPGALDELTRARRAACTTRSGGAATSAHATAAHVAAHATAADVAAHATAADIAAYATAADIAAYATGTDIAARATGTDIAATAAYVAARATADAAVATRGVTAAGGNDDEEQQSQC